jgi:hypothetical protein
MDLRLAATEERPGCVGEADVMDQLLSDLDDVAPRDVALDTDITHPSTFPDMDCCRARSIFRIVSDSPIPSI